jgi:hypothetical protein
LGIVDWVGVVLDDVGFGENGKVARKLLFIRIPGVTMMRWKRKTPWLWCSLSRGKACVSLN